MHDSVEENFRVEGRPAWTPLAPSTLRKRRQSGSNAKILQRTGRLAASITPDSGRDYAVVGINVVYAPIQHFGGTIQRAAFSPESVVILSNAHVRRRPDYWKRRR